MSRARRLHEIWVGDTRSLLGERELLLVSFLAAEKFTLCVTLVRTVDQTGLALDLRRVQQST